MTGGSPSPEQIRDFVIASHGDLDKVKQMLSEHPQLLTASHPWTESDRETPIQAAAQVGNIAVAEYLLQKGAPLEICTAAALGLKDDVERLLAEDPGRLHAKGAHGIPLLTHAALSGNLELVRFLFQRGTETGLSAALHNAANGGHYNIVNWILKNGKPDLAWKNYKGKTALAMAVELKDKRIAQLLRDHGAEE